MFGTKQFKSLSPIYNIFSPETIHQVFMPFLLSNGAGKHSEAEEMFKHKTRVIVSNNVYQTSSRILFIKESKAYTQFASF